MTCNFFTPLCSRVLFGSPEGSMAAEDAPFPTAPMKQQALGATEASVVTPVSCFALSCRPTVVLMRWRYVVSVCLCVPVCLYVYACVPVCVCVLQPGF